MTLASKDKLTSSIEKDMCGCLGETIKHQAGYRDILIEKYLKFSIIANVELIRETHQVRISLVTSHISVLSY